jgi:putative adhesin
MGSLMPNFNTPEPITLELDLSVADVRIQAGDRVETIVEVLPSDASKRDDVGAAERTRVDHTPGRVVVRTPKNWRMYSPFGHGGGVEVRVQLPAGSRVAARSAMGSIHANGPLGASHVKTGMGDIEVDQAATARLTTGMGDINLGHVTGAAELSTGTGEIRAGVISGTAKLKNATGDVHVARAVRGSVEARTGYGQIEVGIPHGTAAWLDLSTGWGEVRNGLDRSGPPQPGEESVEVRAHSGYGDITITRAHDGAH